MDQHCEMILEEYRQKYHLYEKLDRIVLAELNRVVESFKTIVESVGSRIKTEESLAGKLELKGYKYHESKRTKSHVAIKLNGCFRRA